MSDTVQYLIVAAIVVLCLGYMLRKLLVRLKGGTQAGNPSSACGRCGQCEAGRGGGKGCH